MIHSKQDLKAYLHEDQKRFNDYTPSLKDAILKNEIWYLYHYVKRLRYVEYYEHNNRLFFLWNYIWYKRLSFKLHITIYPNTIGPGLRLYHIGDFIHVGKNVHIGRNCTILPGVVFGNKYEKEENNQVIVGDNCYFGLGVKIFGSIKIGNNVTIGANAVVTHDIPDNAIVGGIPAKIIRFKQ